MELYDETIKRNFKLLRRRIVRIRDLADLNPATIPHSYVRSPELAAAQVLALKGRIVLLVKIEAFSL